MTIDELSILPCGAKFFRADLHIHSFGASHDVWDQLMTPEAIVATAIAENLTLVSVTDHNEIRNVERTIIAARGSDLFVVPGIELSTSDGHLLCYLPTVEALTQLHGRLSFADAGTQTSRCQTSILECLNIVDNLKGLCILAHVDSAKGFEFEVPGNSPHKADVICHAALLGIELKSVASGVSYGISDLDPSRKSLGAERRVRLRLGSRQFLARVMNSDSHNLNALGRNAQGDKRVTRYKMHSPSFEGLRIALQDADARVRIEEQIPFAIPYIAGIHMEGGFLTGQSIHFSPNLNCIIGSRGAGKSTTFEAVRCLSSEAGDAYMLDSEVWPTQIDLFWRDASGQVQTLLRTTGGVLENQDSSFMSPTSFPIDCFGQGDAAKISQTAKDNPQALLRYFGQIH